VLRQPLHDRRSSPWQKLVLLLCLASTAYFANHAINGRHGLEAKKKLIERSSLLEFEIRSLEAVRASLERDVALLSPDLPNSDIVEEIARDLLGYVHPGDRLLVPADPPRTGS
jgi:cell division protein FtsB